MLLRTPSSWCSFSPTAAMSSVNLANRTLSPLIFTLPCSSLELLRITCSVNKLNSCDKNVQPYLTPCFILALAVSWLVSMLVS